GPFTVYYLAKGGRGSGEARNWAPFRTAPEEARAYLKGLAASIVSAPDFDMLPFPLISDRLAPKGMLADAGDYAAILREELELSGEADSFQASYVPTESLRILDPSVPADAERKIRLRLGPFFNFR